MRPQLSFLLVASFVGIAAVLIGLIILPLAPARQRNEPAWEPAPALHTHVTIAPERGAIFPADRSRMLVRPYSREGPARITGFWTPTSADIAGLEQALAPLLAAKDSGRVGPFRSKRPPLLSYYRQYAGILGARGERLIYVNAFTPAELGLLAELGQDSSAWRHEAVVVCDGGDSFLGVEYDPGTRRFRGFAFNGVA